MGKAPTTPEQHAKDPKAHEGRERHTCPTDRERNNARRKRVIGVGSGTDREGARKDGTERTDEN